MKNLIFCFCFHYWGEKYNWQTGEATETKMFKVYLVSVHSNSNRFRLGNWSTANGISERCRENTADQKRGRTSSTGSKNTEEARAAVNRGCFRCWEGQLCLPRASEMKIRSGHYPNFFISFNYFWLRASRRVRENSYLMPRVEDIKAGLCPRNNNTSKDQKESKLLQSTTLWKCQPCAEGQNEPMATEKRTRIT